LKWKYVHNLSLNYVQFSKMYYQHAQGHNHTGSLQNQMGQNHNVHTVYLLARTLSSYLDSALCFGGLKLPRIFLLLFFVVPELPAWKAFQLFTLFCLDSWNKQLTHTSKFTQIITIKAQWRCKLNSLSGVITSLYAIFHTYRCIKEPTIFQFFSRLELKFCWIPFIY
jgi:hypothetical protein